ncbi:MAG: gamma-glutamyltransferase family protein [Armatimonadetes bacterium]|nr:gamma-glutamyltransferase family protein [Armatimonadota bacterium]
MPTHRPPIMGTHYMVASGHYLATLAGIRILERGGNAVDAGVAAGLCINVLQPDMTNVGGVAPIILRSARTGEVVTISGLGRWPKAATLEVVLARGGGDLPLGVLRSVTPAAIDAWLTALERYGTKTLAQVAAPAMELAADGFPVNRFLHDNLARAAEVIARWTSTAAIFLPGGRVPEVGDVLVQRDLARTLQRLAEAEGAAASKGDSREEAIRTARDLFYRGAIAREIVDFCRAEGGLLSLEDMAAFSVRVEPPVRATYRGHEVYGCGPWCQGPVALEALNILEGYDLRATGHLSAETLHLIIEALTAAFADRHAYYGDPDFVQVPISGLLAKAYAAEWRRRMEPRRAWSEMPSPGDPWVHEGAPAVAGGADAPAPKNGPIEPDTSYLCVIDAEGNAFSATPSDGVLSTPVVPGLGLIISSRGYQSWLDPHHPSCVAPGKRPRLTPSPGLVMRDGRVFLAYGTPGHDVQPQAMVQVLVNMLDFGMDPQEAIEAPRLATYNFPSTGHPHAYHPGLVRVESRVPEEVRGTLAAWGHKVEAWPAWMPSAGAVCAIRARWDRGRPLLVGGADPRRLAYAIGW